MSQPYRHGHKSRNKVALVDSVSTTVRIRLALRMTISNLDGFDTASAMHAMLLVADLLHSA